jgi:hypothetical protein
MFKPFVLKARVVQFGLVSEVNPRLGRIFGYPIDAGYLYDDLESFFAPGLREIDC